MGTPDASVAPQLGEFVDLIRRGRPDRLGFYLSAPVECVTAEGWTVTVAFEEPEVERVG